MKILLIVQPERFDFYNYLSKDIENEYVLLWYEKESMMKLQKDELPVRFSSIYYWTDFFTPSDLLKKIKPDKIIFFEIIDLRQIALIVSAKAYKIRTFYLEHGAAGSRETAILRWDETTFVRNKIPYFVNRLIKHLPLIVKSKVFYFSVFKGFTSLQSYFRYVCLPVILLFKPSNKVLAHNTFRERVPDYSILFNESNFQQYELYTGVEKEDVLLTGVPHFDSYLSAFYKGKDHWIYIDHPYLEGKLLGWDKKHHSKIAKQLFNYANTNRQKIYVKLHPKSDISLWHGYDNPGNYIEVIQFGDDFTQLYLESKLILAFSSSLVIGFLCAKKNVVLLGWHPQPTIFGVDFSKTGLCHISYSVDDLYSKVQTWESINYCMDKPDQHTSYVRKFNFPFDGMAIDRVLKAINTL